MSSSDNNILESKGSSFLKIDERNDFILFYKIFEKKTLCKAKLEGV